jgi:hypothetical protein
MFRRGTLVRPCPSNIRDDGKAANSPRASHGCTRIELVYQRRSSARGTAAHSQSESAVEGVDTKKVGLEVGVPYRIELYTHCGIDFWTQFDGSYWDAVKYDNSTGNPPQGLGNPSDFGTMTLLSKREAEYVSESGKVFRFTRAAERPKGMICF